MGILSEIAKYYTEKVVSKINWADYTTNNPELYAAVEVLNAIKHAGYDAYIVGGFVRDLLMDKSSDDIDIASNIPTDKLSTLFDIHDVGKSKDFGVNVITYKGFQFEIANFREDVYNNLLGGKGADATTVVNDFEADTKRRDFTINSMGIDADGNVTDFHGGIDDISNRRIRTVGNPEDRFKEDRVRMLRGVRFASRLGYDIDPETLNAIKVGSSEIQKVAAERITKELLKMAEQDGGRFADAILTLKDTGMLQHILPEVLKMDEFEHSPEHHPEGNVFQHTIAALRASKTENPIINLAILLHDVGKTVTHNVDEKGIHRYFGHAEKGIDLIDSIANRLKMDTKTRDALKFAAINHMKMPDILKMTTSKILKLMSSPYWDVLLSVAEADAKSRGELFDENQWREIVNALDTMKNKEASSNIVNTVKKIVNGGYVMAILGVKKGNAQVGKVITDIVDWIIDNNVDVSSDMKLVDDKIRELGTKHGIENSMHEAANFYLE